MRKVNGARNKPQNPLDFAVKQAVKVWNVAIGAVDRHALSCGSCNKRRNPHNLAVIMGVIHDPKLEAYQLCGTAGRLYEAEKAARIDYLAAGGILPTK